MEEIKVRELPEKSSIDTINYIIVEDDDGTKKTLVKNFRSLLLSSLYFNSVEDLKNSTDISLKEGDICETLGYHTPGDGGAAKYKITYNPAAVEDGKLVHYLAYSDTLRAEIILEDFINVHQFGAYGDGKTDDSAAIQFAVDNSDYRIIEFSNNKNYMIRNSININKDNTIIKGNGGVLNPYYVDGLNITSSNVTIDNLHFDCNRATTAIHMLQSSKVDINGCKVYNVTNTGIEIQNSEFINISYCDLSGQANGSLITLDGNTESRFINVLDCDFSNFAKAVHILTSASTGELNTLVNLDKCNYHSTATNSYCVYIACPIDMLSIFANTVSAVDTFLYFGGAAKGDVSCRGISCLNTSKVFDIGTSQGVLHLDGSIKVSNSTVLFENMNGKLRSSISWDLLPNGASFTNKPIGEIYDAIHPYNYAENRGYSVSGSRLTLRQVRNMNIDWNSSTANITEIVNGVKGQVIYLKSSTGKSILSSANSIILSDSTIKLGQYKGILMKFDGTKWAQIQYQDSTVVQTVAEELEIDYSQIAFDTSHIVGLQEGGI